MVSKNKINFPEQGPVILPNKGQDFLISLKTYKNVFVNQQLEEIISVEGGGVSLFATHLRQNRDSREKLCFRYSG